MRSLPLLALISAVAPGCAYALPFVVPPAHIHLATGAAEGVITAPGPAVGSGPSTGPVQRTGDLYAEVRGSIDIQSAMIKRRRRGIDVSPGYGALFFLPRLREPYVHHGPYLEFGFEPMQLFPDENTVFRTYISLAPQLVLADLGGGTAVGGAIRAGITAEVVGFANSGTGHRTHRGANWYGWWGEYAVSLELSTGVEYIVQNAFWTIALGVSVRIPSLSALSAGVMYPGDGGDAPANNGGAP